MGAYEPEHQTRPLTLAQCLSDSPAGMAAWILEKWRAWSDCGGELEAVVPRPDLITLLTLYWCTGTQVTGLLPYWERTHLESSVPERLAVPTGVFVTRKDGVVMPPRELVAAGATFSARSSRLWPLNWYGRSPDVAATSSRRSHAIRR